MARDGATIGRVGEPVDAWDLRIAPDGRRVAITELDPQLRTLDVFIREGSQPVAHAAVALDRRSTRAACGRPTACASRGRRRAGR